MKFNKKKVIEEVATSFRIHGIELCGIDMLVRVDEYDGKFLDCDECVFRDTNEFVDFLGCPFNWGCTFGTYKSMVK